MTREQILLIQLLMGKALDAILTGVADMNPEQVWAATKAEESKTSDLLDEMKALG